jgi:hypothetical protein
MTDKNGLTIVLAVFLVLSFWLVAPSAVQAEADASPGIVVSVAGSVTIERSGSQEEATEGFALRGGDRIILKTGARCSGFTPQGTDFELDGPSEFLIPSGEELGLVDNVTSWIKMQLADWMGESRRRPLTTRGVRDWDTVSETPALILPASGGAVRPSRVELRWSTVTGVDRYVVTVAPALGDELVLTARGNTTTLDQLDPGGEYVWRVAPDVADWAGSGGWREFRVLATEEEQRLDEALVGMDDLEAGVLLLSMGLHDEAIYRFDAAAAGDNALSARHWRAQALAECGLYREAYDDLIQLRGNE